MPTRLQSGSALSLPADKRACGSVIAPPRGGGALAPLREFDDVLRDRTFGGAGNLELDLDRAQDLSRLSGDSIRPIWQDVLVLQIGQRLPKDVLQATSRERPDYLHRLGASCDRVLGLPLAVCGVALCSCHRFGI